MRILVTGHRGYVGSVTTAVLAAAGHDVSGLDTGYYEGCDFGAEPPDDASRRLDVRDVREADFEGFDAVVHLAALSNDPIGDLDPDLTRRINLDGTVAIARLAREAGVRRFVFASSCSIYGASGSDDALDEEAPFRPLTPYAESKVRSEEALAGLAADGFAPIFMRNATVYGVSPRLRLDVVLNNLAAWAHTTGAVRLLSDGSAWRPLIHVRDVALVTKGVLEAPEHLVHNQAFNVGSDEQNYRIAELARLLSAESGCEVELADDAQPDQRSYRVDFGKLRRTLPEVELQWDAARGAHELLEAYREHGLTREEFEGRSYVRLRQLRHLLDNGSLDADLRWAGAAGEASGAVRRD